MEVSAAVERRVCAEDVVIGEEKTVRNVRDFELDRFCLSRRTLRRKMLGKLSLSEQRDVCQFRRSELQVSTEFLRTVLSESKRTLDRRTTQSVLEWRRQSLVNGTCRCAK